jgi:hypothetical protein
LEPHPNLTYIFLSWSLPEGLAIATSAVYLGAMRIMAPRGSPIKPFRIRILSFLGLFSCILSGTYTILIGGTWNGLILAEPLLLSAVLLFGILIFRPDLASKSKLRIYLGACVVLSGLCAVASIWVAWSLTR